MEQNMNPADDMLRDALALAEAYARGDQMGSTAIVAAYADRSNEDCLQLAGAVAFAANAVLQRALAESLPDMGALEQDPTMATAKAQALRDVSLVSFGQVREILRQQGRDV